MKIVKKFLSSKELYLLCQRVLPWLYVLTVVALSYGLVGGLILSPADYQQGDAFRIMYVHVPSAILSLMAYAVMTACAFIYLIFKVKVADLVVKLIPSLGLSFTVLALVTGAIWGKPMWGTFWMWDARLTSELILAFIYLGILMMRMTLPEDTFSKKMIAMVVLIGFVDIPIIHFSVNWWNTLHQGASLTAFKRPSIAPAMLYPLIGMIVGFMALFFVSLCARLKQTLLWQDKEKQWVKLLVEEQA